MILGIPSTTSPETKFPPLPTEAELDARRNGKVAKEDYYIPQYSSTGKIDSSDWITLTGEVSGYSLLSPRNGHIAEIVPFSAQGASPFGLSFDNKNSVLISANPIVKYSDSNLSNWVDKYVVLHPEKILNQKIVTIGKYKTLEFTVDKLNEVGVDTTGAILEYYYYPDFYDNNKAAVRNGLSEDNQYMIVDGGDRYFLFSINKSADQKYLDTYYSIISSLEVFQPKSPTIIETETSENVPEKHLYIPKYTPAGKIDTSEWETLSGEISGFSLRAPKDYSDLGLFNYRDVASDYFSYSFDGGSDLNIYAESIVKKSDSSLITWVDKYIVLHPEKILNQKIITIGKYQALEFVTGNRGFIKDGGVNPVVGFNYYPAFYSSNKQAILSDLFENNRYLVVDGGDRYIIFSIDLADVNKPQTDTYNTIVSSLEIFAPKPPEIENQN
ncbi:MAG: hypothetical protein RLZZ230_400 [Candidatus Parcubacteria bacterium]